MLLSVLPALLYNLQSVLTRGAFAFYDVSLCLASRSVRITLRAFYFHDPDSRSQPFVRPHLEYRNSCRHGQLSSARRVRYRRQLLFLSGGHDGSRIFYVVRGAGPLLFRDYVTKKALVVSFICI